MKLIGQFGRKWSVISKNIKGRTENAVKNRYHSICKQTVSKDSQKSTTTNSLHTGRVSRRLRKKPRGRSHRQLY